MRSVDAVNLLRAVFRGLGQDAAPLRRADHPRAGEAERPYTVQLQTVALQVFW